MPRIVAAIIPTTAQHLESDPYQLSLTWCPSGVLLLLSILYRAALALIQRRHRDGLSSHDLTEVRARRSTGPPCPRSDMTKNQPAEPILAWS